MKPRRILLISAVFILGPIQSAQACDGCVISAVQANMAGIVAELLKLEGTVANSINALKDTLIQAQSDIADAMTKKAVALQEAGVRGAAPSRYQMATNACGSATLASGIQQGQANASGFSSGVQSSLMNYNQNQPSQAKAAGAMYANHVNSYCDSVDVAAGRCTSKSGLPGGDIQVDSLLEGAGTPALTFNNDQQQAALEYIRNATNAIPSPKLPPELEKTPEGEAYVTMQLAEQSKLSIGQKAFSDALAIRLPGSGATSKESWLESIKTEVDNRWANPNWHAQMAAASPEAVERERALMDALSLNLQMKRFLQGEKIELLLAGMYTNQVRSFDDPKLTAQRVAVEKSQGEK
jgi:hypothetical protein